MLYTDFEYYKVKYLGNIDEDTFDRVIIKASREIDNNINTRLSQEKINNLPEEAQDQLKYTACALVDLISKKEDDEKIKVSSVSIDGVSKSFSVMKNDEYKKLKSNVLKSLPDELTRYI